MSFNSEGNYEVIVDSVSVGGVKYSRGDLIKLMEDRTTFFRFFGRAQSSRLPMRSRSN